MGHAQPTFWNQERKNKLVWMNTNKQLQIVLEFRVFDKELIPKTGVQSIADTKCSVYFRTPYLRCKRFCGQKQKFKIAFYEN